MLELDLYFERFIKSGKLDMLSAIELKVYEELLTLEDSELLLLLQGSLVLENQAMQKLVDNIINNIQIKNLN
jgi:succinate dehydrogenase flavin-adding protein (antitoxin of CptAB toxin-antitoxin module)